MISEIMENRWFKNIKFYIEDDRLCNVVEAEGAEDANLILNQSELKSESGFETSWSWSRRASTLLRPVSLIVFDIVLFSHGFNLSGLFEEGGEEARFVSGVPVSKNILKLEEIARLVSFTVRVDCWVSLEGSKEGVKGLLTFATEINICSSISWGQHLMR
jgi:hypothetical protein